MSIQQILRASAILTLALVVQLHDVVARTKDVAKKKDAETVQRDEPTGVYDQQRNIISAIDFWTTNYGIFGYNVRNGIGGLFWPRGTQNQYGFAGGAWFGALKKPLRGTDLRKRVMITYNPNSGTSWMAPGSIADGLTEKAEPEDISKNKVYFSTDFKESDGTNIQSSATPNWPIWDSDPDKVVREGNYYGNYINNVGERNRQNNRKGPAFISQEDIVSVYKDTDLNRYEGGIARRQAEGFPLGLQIEQTIYSWGFGDYADFLFIKYMFIHPETFPDTLFACWMGGVQDVDIAIGTNSQLGADNDRARYYEEEDTLNLAIQWTNVNRQEGGRGFGYMGFNFLESPAVDVDGYIRKDKLKFNVTEQLGLKTMRNWPIIQDPIENEDRYNFMSSEIKDPDLGPGDRRLMMATGPFNMRPGDSARIVVGLVLASTATPGQEATGTTADAAELIRKVRFAQFVYNNNFRAPRAPDLTQIKGVNQAGTFPEFPAAGWLPLNNAIAIQWDSTAEMSVDTLERGLDFLGYRIYRARRTDLDTFDRDEIATQRKGPLGWKQVAQYGMTPMFEKSNERAGNTGNFADQFQFIDIIKAGQRKILVRRSPSFILPWGGLFSQLFAARDTNYRLTTDASGSIDVSKFDRLDSILYTYYELTLDTLPIVRRNANGSLNAADSTLAMDSLRKLINLRRVVQAPFLFRDTIRIANPDGTFEIENVLRPFEETNFLRREVIAPYMRAITNNRTFFDDGDDDNDGTIRYDQDPRRSEKLINNIKYYYAVRAYDEGDQFLPTPSKLNARNEGLPNVAVTNPIGARPGEAAKFNFRLDEETKSRLGGIYNVRLLIQNEQLFNQLFGGRTLELTFYREWFPANLGNGQNALPSIGIYATRFILRDSATHAQIGVWASALPPELCPTTNSGFVNYFTENSRTWVDTSSKATPTPRQDTVFNPDGTVKEVVVTDFNLPENTQKILRTGTFTSDARCFGLKYAYGTVGLAFDYTIEQSGGVYRRADTLSTVVSGPTNFYVGASSTEVKTYVDQDQLNSQPAWYEPPYPGAQIFLPKSYNNGRGDYELEFLPGGTETIETVFQTSVALAGDATDGVKRARFENVPYLNVRLRNTYSFERVEIAADGSTRNVTVSYPGDYVNEQPPIGNLRTNWNQYPYVQQLSYDGFAIAAYGWRNTRSTASIDPSSQNFKSATIRFMAADSALGRPVGLGKYYLSRALSSDGVDTLDFVHVLAVAGAEYVIDFSKRGRRNAAQSLVPASAGITARPFPDKDFAAGDKIQFRTQGGAFGFPLDGAKAFAKVEQYDPEIAQTGQTDEQLEQITVTPNPYYLSHEGINTPFQSKLYFSRLPRKATITIYTINGDIVKKIEHDEATSDSPTMLGTEVWDLLTTNRQRVVSQTLVAKIETPSGAAVTRKFTIVVGTARLIGDTE